MEYVLYFRCLQGSDYGYFSGKQYIVNGESYPICDSKIVDRTKVYKSSKVATNAGDRAIDKYEFVNSYEVKPYKNESKTYVENIKMDKYAIYKSKSGLRSVLYVDSIEGLTNYPYISESALPVTINRFGGYNTFDLDLEKDFIEIIEVEYGTEPLTREQMFPKNSSEFEYGWINLDGDTYSTGFEGHGYSADFICEEYGYSSYRSEYVLEELGWVKVTSSYKNGVRETAVYVKNNYVTKKQADRLIDLNLYNVGYVSSFIKYSEEKW